MAKAMDKVGQETRSISVIPKPWTHQTAFWGLAGILILAPFFRGLFFNTDQQFFLIMASILVWFAWLWKYAEREYGFLSHPLDYLIAALPVVYLFSAVNAANYGLALDEFVKNILYFSVYWLVVQLIRDERSLHQMLNAIYLAAFGVALAGLATATGLVSIKDGFLNGRIYSSFQYPNALSSYLAIALFLGLYFWQRYGVLTIADTVTDRFLKQILPGWLQKIKPYGYLYILINFTLLVVLFGAKSRGGLLASAVIFIIYLALLNWSKRLPVLFNVIVSGVISYLVIYKFIALAQAKQMGFAWLWFFAGIVVLAVLQYLYNLLLAKGVLTWLKSRLKTNWTLAGTGIVIIAAAAVGTALHPGLLNKIASFSYLRNAFERFYFVRDALDMIKARPLLGWGGGGWEEAYRSFQHYLYNSKEVHSYYFQVAVETGIIGLLVVLGIWAAFFWLGHRVYHRSLPDGNRRTLIVTLLAGAVVVGGHALIDFDLSLSALTIVLWVLFACMRVLESVPGTDTVPGQNQQATSGTAGGQLKEVKVNTGKKKKRRKAKDSGKQPAVSARNLQPLNPVVLSISSLVCLIFLLLGMSLASANMYSSNAAKETQSMQKALQDMQIAAVRNPLSAEYHSNLANLYFSQGEYDKALDEARRASGLSRYSSSCKQDLAAVSLYTGQSGQAVSYAKQGVELAPYDIQGYENLAKICSLAGRTELSQGKKDQARSNLQETFKISALIANRMSKLTADEKKLWRDGPMLSITPGIQLYQGEAHLLLGNLPEAEKNLQNAAADSQIQGEAFLWLALLKDNQGKGLESEEFLKKAMKINQSYNQAYQQLKLLTLGAKTNIEGTQEPSEKAAVADNVYTNVGKAGL